MPGNGAANDATDESVQLESFVHKEAKESTREVQHRRHHSEKEMPQTVLNIFRDACRTIISDNDFTKNLNHIKQLFFKRDFIGIFGNQTLLPVYTAEYAPSRALCYHELFVKNNILSNILLKSSDIFCMGSGNGAELVGISSALFQLSTATNRKIPKEVTIHSQDLADYSAILNSLDFAVNNTFGLNISSKFSVYDILEEQNFPTLFKDINQVHLITAFFLLNEILATSKSSFVKLISQLVNNMTVGAYLLVIDSAGSFSELDISGKKYMCYQLLDHMKVFECEFKSDAQWFRFPSGLHYPLKLNNMRYFCRLYKRV